MKRVLFFLSAMLMGSICAYAVDGQVLINQATLNAAGGFYTISQPGSYKLSGNLGSATVCVTVGFIQTPCAIFIDSSNVILDLGGFTISGSNGSALVIASAVQNITVRNGTLVGTNPFMYYIPNSGTPGGAPDYMVVEDLRLLSGGFTVGRFYRVSRVLAPMGGVSSDAQNYCPGLVSDSVFGVITRVCTSVGNSTN